MNTLVHSGVFWIGLIAGLMLLYFLPTMIGIIRKVENLGLLSSWTYCRPAPDSCRDGDASRR
jgi:hypothetical protein